ncbi:DUF1566 domain-containing protein [Fluoribacter dumoffii]|uniref:Uncharacterized protein n=1 Tax=Fluoribacter dumoffii TaxID=463 RepID=A0A377G5D6_9GAMM|nr:DUF1566 domain-containing protein [Fluoribacter dumoffii]KTC91508.1 hypothetical protein Ldum_2576 [Fluoribacter dumoffii NY 23]MCW8387368.1 DUF1566 domain-containing protein [Fluoribacter dumoffii]MCW8417125.1 DUF1566 domain-containing protein [Fluoribacter dumoffii]MCW8455035.1 DUF1566 domain-containing protein [Fluoribacter dumoffii]MCW8460888.1 DUF1566 domain-containing protein [Fluoribacter dumoffii]
MRCFISKRLYFALLFILPLHLIWAAATAGELATLSINSEDTVGVCATSLQNCVIQISLNRPQCLPKPGAVTITNNSKIVAKNIRASSSDSNFINYVIQNNGCPSSLSPGQSCTISFFTNTSIAFLISNVLVKGTNTSSTFFDMRALTCVSSQARLSASPTSVNLTYAGASKSVTVTNSGNAGANNVQATFNSPSLGISVTSNCPSVLAPNASCQFTFTPGPNAGSTSVTIAGSNTVNSVTIGITETIPQATLSVSPTTLNIHAGGETQSVTVTNIGTLDASVVQASLAPSPSLNIVVTNSCPSSLAPNTSCQITFQSGNVTGTTTATIFGANTSNSIPVTINVIPVAATTISVPTTAIIPLDDPAGINVTVLNLTSNPAYNVKINLPSAWTTVSSTTCPVIGGNGSCTINIASNAFSPAVAQGGILVDGDNISSPPSIALAFSYFDYLIYSVQGLFNIYVVKDVDESSGYVWSLNTTSIPGITETSTVSGGDVCDGATDGSCDTNQIFSFYQPPATPPDNAATLCYQITNDNSGSVMQGTWYLPAICELGIYTPSLPNSSNAGCPSGIENIFSNLYSLGFLTDLTGRYWSSTEYSSPQSNAWYQEFFGNQQSTQGVEVRPSLHRVRCVRAFLTV